MEKLAILGGGRTVPVRAKSTPLIAEASVRALQKAAEAARQDASYLCALSGSGPVARLESSMRELTGARHALALSSGTAAIFTALLAAGVGPGDEVIVPAYTWPQSVAPILQVGATVVYADIDPCTMTLDPGSLRRRLTPRTRAVIAVHLYGHPADVPALRAAIADPRVLLIEDAAQAVGARLGRKAVGALGDCACVSLGREKPVSGGEGGLLLTRRVHLYERAVSLTQHPLRQAYELRRLGEFGYNLRMHPLAAVLAASELELCEERRSRRDRFFRRLSTALDKIAGIRPPECAPGVAHAWYRYCPTYVPEELGGLPRRLYVAALAAEGVPLAEDALRPPLHQRRVPRRFPRPLRARLPVTEDRSHRVGLTLDGWPAEQGDPALAELIAHAFRKVAAQTQHIKDEVVSSWMTG